MPNFAVKALQSIYMKFNNSQKAIKQEISSLEANNSFSACKKFLAFNGARRCITVFARTHHYPYRKPELLVSKHVLPPYFSNIHFNTVLPFRTRSSKRSLSFRFPIQRCMHFSTTRNSSATYFILHLVIIQIANIYRGVGYKL